MAKIDLLAALRLMRRFGDSPEVVSVIDATLNELERLYKIEAAYNDPDIQEVIGQYRDALRQQPAPDADWTAANRMVER